MASYAELKDQQESLIRKATQGSVFIAASTAQLIAALTEYTAAVPASAGPPAVEAKAAYIDLAPLPVGYTDLGLLTNDGAQFSREVSTSDVTSWGRVSPTRTDVTTDTSTLAVAAQETSLLTIGLGTGISMAGVVPNAETGEVDLIKPGKPSQKTYRALALSVDENDAGEIFIARFLPFAKVTGFADQAFGGGDDPITWGVTFTGNEDPVAKYAERWLFGGAGWNAQLADMGFVA